MKRTSILLLMILIGSLISYSQEGLKGNYYFKNNLISEFSNQKEFLGSRENLGNNLAITKNHVITVLKEDSTFVYFKYWNFKDSASIIKYNSNKIFTIPRTEFIQLANPRYGKYKGANVGAYVVPFRLRGIGKGDFDFESSLSLSANMIFGFGSIYKKESIFDASFGVGLTKVNLTEKNSIVEKNRTASAFTLSLGGVIKPGKNINGGVFIGWDFLGASDKDVAWVYNKKMWLGLGINIRLNKIEAESNDTKIPDKATQPGEK